VSPDPHAPLWPLVLYASLSFILVVFMIAFSYVLGQRHREHATAIPYESGMMPTGAAWTRFDVKYYLLAVFFVIFDLEAVFIFAWAISLKRAGWAGYFEMLVFILILLAVLGYLWRIGALDWSTFSERDRVGPGLSPRKGGE
jgi:NADH-quinone oxidoreductase subunit A